jgi:predicted nucleic acid-binding protein
LSIDLDALLRRRKPERRGTALAQRPLDALLAAESVADQPGRLSYVPDTTVYIHQASGRLPSGARRLIERGLAFHCTVCLSELTVGLGHRNPEVAGYKDAREHFIELFESIPTSRVLQPDPTTFVDAGLIAGVLARVQTFQAAQRKQCLNDALIYLTAARAGYPVLTENRAEFDLIQQLAPKGAFIFY